MYKLTLTLFLLLSFASYAQNSKLIKGKVNYMGSYQKNIEIINFTSKKMTTSTVTGEFQIEVKIDDVLVLLSETFADQKYKITTEDLEKNIVVINLVEKPIPLDEVEITQVQEIKGISVSYNDLKMTKIQKDAERPKNNDVYTGELINGVDFVQIGKMIGKLFKSKKPKAKTAPKVTFKEYAITNFNETFFIKTLKLKPEETGRFLDYCEADPNSKTIIDSTDELFILEFLMKKKSAFDALR